MSDSLYEMLDHCRDIASRPAKEQVFRVAMEFSLIERRIAELKKAARAIKCELYEEIGRCFFDDQKCDACLRRKPLELDLKTCRKARASIRKRLLRRCAKFERIRTGGAR